MIYTDETFADGDYREKLIPDLERSADDQVIWLGLGVLVIMAVVFLGASLSRDATGGLSGMLGSGEKSAELTIGEVLSDESDLAYTNQLFEQADINRDLARSSQGPYTVFAPTDSAWEELADADDLIDDLTTTEAGEAVGFHIVVGEYTLNELLSEGSVITIDGYTLTFDDDELINGNVEIDGAELKSSNGIVHKIDTVLPTG